MAALKNCEPELSYVLVELFNKCLKESCFPDCWEVSSVVPVFKTFRDFVVTKVFEELINNRIIT